jgi:hypothetical protein
MLVCRTRSVDDVDRLSRANVSQLAPVSLRWCRRFGALLTKGERVNASLSAQPVVLPIAAIERDTGLSKDTLRVWERHYGFPVPMRDSQGERSYPLDQLQRLRAIKRLIDGRHRPGVSCASMPANWSGCCGRPACRRRSQAWRSCR